MKAGPREKATVALQGIWRERRGFHSRGIFDKSLEPLVDGALLGRARQAAREGARARFRGAPTRLKALPHPSAKDYLDEVMGALWKDAAKGRVLLRTNSVGRRVFRRRGCPNRTLIAPWATRAGSSGTARCPTRVARRRIARQRTSRGTGTWPALFCGGRPGL